MIVLKIVLNAKFEPAETRLVDRTQRLSVESLLSLFHRSASLLFLLYFFSSFQSFPSLLSLIFSSLAPPFSSGTGASPQTVQRSEKRAVETFPEGKKKESRIVMNPVMILYGVFRVMLIDCFTIFCKVYCSPQF